MSGEGSRWVRKLLGKKKPSVEFIDWTDGFQDNDGTRETELHEAYHEKLAASIPPTEKLFSNPRIESLSIAEDTVGRPISGHILDLGCGNGYLSAWLAQNRKVKEVYAFELTTSAVTKLIPKVIESTGTRDDLVRPVKGSFNHIPVSDHFDYIIASGSMHHARYLFHVISECRKALKPGACLVVQDWCWPDTTSVEYLVETYDAHQNFQGIADIQQKDRNEFSYRECEFKVAVHQAGLNLLAFDYVDHLMPNLEERNIPQRPFVMVASKPEAPLARIPHKQAIQIPETIK